MAASGPASRSEGVRPGSGAPRYPVPPFPPRRTRTRAEVAGAAAMAGIGRWSVRPAASRGLDLAGPSAKKDETKARPKRRPDRRRIRRPAARTALCVCCVCKRERESVCVCVCVCVRALACVRVGSKNKPKALPLSFD